MEEIKNWWGVFGLFGCVTVVSSSLERRCHRQGSLTALTNPAISIHWHASRVAHTESARIEMHSTKAVDFFSLIMTCVCVFPLICYFLLSLRVDLLVGLVTESSYTELVSTAITSTTLLCWNGLRLLFIVLLLLERSQLYSVSTVPVEPWGVALETSVSYQH